MQVIHRNRFITSTKELSWARRHPPTDPLLGYMITNFNDISFEHGNMLEMTLDWCGLPSAVRVADSRRVNISSAC